MTPPIRITDPAFKYTPSHLTNIKVRFDKIRREMAEQQKQGQVVPIKRENRK